MMIIITLIFLIIDIVSKIIVSNCLSFGESISLIDNFLRITYVKNTGAAFSMFSSQTYVVLILSMVIIGMIFWYVYKNRPNTLSLKIAYSMILGGAIGNFVDRIIYGYVRDFIDFKIFGYDAPIFNLADTFIVLGVIYLIFYTWRCNDNGDSSIRKK